MGSIESSVERMAVALERLVALLEAHPREMVDTDNEDGVPEPPCPNCGEARNIENTSAPGADLRRTCKECGTSYLLEVIHG